MSKRVCRVCGKEYDVCKNGLRNPNMTFRWQEVACSHECGSEYFRRVAEARNTTQEPIKKAKTTSKKASKEKVEYESEDTFEHIFKDEDVEEL